MVVRKFCRETDTLFLYNEMEKNGLLTDQIIGSDIEFIGYFEHQLRYYYSDFWVIENSDSNEPIGFLYTWDYRVKDGHCHLDYHLLDASPDQILELIQQIIALLFTEYPLNCIFLYAAVDNKARMELCTRLAAQEDALLKEYFFQSGIYEDIRVMRIDRSEFESRG